MKFGLSQIWKESPLFISRLKRALNFVIFSIGAVSPKLCEWYGWTSDGILATLSIAGLGINVLGIMFGVEPSESKGEFERENDIPPHTD